MAGLGLARRGQVGLGMAWAALDDEKLIGADLRGGAWRGTAGQGMAGFG